MKSLSKILLAFYLLLLLWLVLLKYSSDFHLLLGNTRSLNLIPFADYSRDNLRDVMVNFVGFIPFGLLLSVNLKQTSFWRKLAFVFIFSLGLELIQFILAIGVMDVTDVVTNTSGGLLGLVLYDLSNKHVHHEKLDRSIALAGTILLTLLILILGILLSSDVRHPSAPPGGERRLRR